MRSNVDFDRERLTSLGHQIRLDKCGKRSQARHVHAKLDNRHILSHLRLETTAAVISAAAESSKDSEVLP